MEAFQRDIDARLGVIKRIAEMLTLIHQQRLYTNGNVREAYSEVLRTELFRMMREVDDFKVAVCSQLADIDAERIMNISRFPILGPNGPTGC